MTPTLRKLRQEKSKFKASLSQSLLLPKSMCVLISHIYLSVCVRVNMG